MRESDLDLGTGPSRWTVRPSRLVLAVVRTSTSLNRLIDVLSVLTDHRVAIKFTIDEGSKFSRLVTAQLAEIGAEVLSWSEACAVEFDLIVAAHVDPNLAQLRGPLVVLPHGAGYSRRVATSTGGAPVAAGLSAAELTHNGAVFPTAIGLSHDEQLTQLSDTCPEALSRAVVIGDPTFDRLLDSSARRARYRAALRVPADCCLVLVSSTWSEHSVLGHRVELIHQLAARLPMDHYRVAVVLHHNIWAGHSEFEIKYMLREALDSGILIIRPMTWQGGLLSADVIVGDHGSVSFYGAGLGLPYLRAVDGRKQLEPGSPAAALARAAIPLDIDGDFRTQMDIAWRARERFATITDRVLGRRGRSWHILFQLFYDLMALPPPRSSARMLPIRDPVVFSGNDVTAWLIDVAVSSRTRTTGHLELWRYPAIVRGYRGLTDRADLVQAVDITEADPLLRRNADIIFRAHVLADRDAAGWTKQALDDNPGAAMVAATTSTGCLLRWHRGPLWEATVSETPQPRALVAAAAVYGWLVDAHPITTRTWLGVRLGSAETTVVVRPVS